MEDNSKLKELITKLIEGKGELDYFLLATELGFTEEESKKKVPHLLIKFAKYSKDKALEAKKILSRTDVKEQISSVLTSVGEKIETMLESDGDINEELSKALTVFNSTFDRYTKFEGLNKAEKFDLTVNDYDLSLLDDDNERLLFLNLLEKIRKVDI